MIVKNKKEFVDWVNIYNGRMNCYTTVYDFDIVNDKTKIESSVVLNRMFLDFDAHNEPLEFAFDDFVSVGNILTSQEILFNAYFSGKGFHIIAHGEKVDDIRSIQHYYTNLAKDHSSLDRTGIQTNRLRRIPNTLNLSSGKNNQPYFCIPIDFNSIKHNAYDGGLAEILLMAKTRTPTVTMGKIRIVFPEVQPISLAGIEIEIPKPIGTLPIIPCLHNAIMVENPSHYARVYLTQWYRDLLTLGERKVSLEQQKQVVDLIMAEFTTIASLPEVWLDWDYNKTKKYVSGIVSKGYHAVGCTSLINQGYCVGKCWRYHE
tara:strand:- start:1027 stop:1977 length:951 start_codon:yes stop_codon:yes gene_type:complete